MKQLTATTIVFAAAAIALLNSCNSLLPYKMGGIPAKIKPLSSPKEVKCKMGEPEWIEQVNNPNSEIRTIWHYEDYWWTEDRWANKWASWDVYFDANDQFIGWKLVDPPIQEDRARRAVYPGGYLDPNPSHHQHYAPSHQ